MCVALERSGQNGWRGTFAGVFFILAVAAGSSSAAVAATTNSGTITIVLDQAQVMRLPDGVATLVVGNPLIADVSIQAGGLVILTGKGYGVTNLLALDRGGAVLTQKLIEVQGPHGSLVVYRGVERESYSCTPNCEKRITLGDSGPYFDAVLSQATNRTGQAQGSVQSSK